MSNGPKIIYVGDGEMPPQMMAALERMLNAKKDGMIADIMAAGGTTHGRNKDGETLEEHIKNCATCRAAHDSLDLGGMKIQSFDAFLKALEEKLKDDMISSLADDVEKNASARGQAMGLTPGETVGAIMAASIYVTLHNKGNDGRTDDELRKDFVKMFDGIFGEVLRAKAEADKPGA